MAQLKSRDIRTSASRLTLRERCLRSACMQEMCIAPKRCKIGRPIVCIERSLIRMRESGFRLLPFSTLFGNLCTKMGVELEAIT